MLDTIEPAIPARRRGRPASATPDAGEVQSLDRAMALLELLASGEGFALSDLARRAELPPSTVHRLLATLHRRRLVAHDMSSGFWTIGSGLFHIGSAYLRLRKLPDLARPIIRALMIDVGETVNVSMLDQNELICVAQAEAHAPVRAFFRLGRRLPLQASGAGKAILAAGGAALQDQLLRDIPIERFTAKTHQSRDALMQDVAAIVVRGYAIDDEEHTIGMRCASAAILNEWAEPAGSVSISGPTVRMPAERLAVLGPKVMHAARTLSSLFSGQAVAAS